VNFEIKIRVVGLLNLAYQVNESTQPRNYDNSLQFKNSSLFYFKTLNRDIMILGGHNLIPLDHLTS
jgi:hypothetical protein